VGHTLMTSQSNPRLVKRLNIFATASSLFAIVIGISGLMGWTFHLNGLVTWGAAPLTMKVNTAVGLILLGISLRLLRKTDRGALDGAKKLVARTAAAVVSTVGLFSLAENFFGWHFGIDQFLMMAPPGEPNAGMQPGLMSPITAGGFLLLGLALLGIDWRTRRGRRPTQVLALASGGMATFGIMTFAFDPHVYAAHLSLALPTAVSLTILSLGVVCSRTEWGLGALLCSRSLGGSLARRLLPAAFIPVVVGWIRWQVTNSGLYSEWSIVVLASLTTMCLLAGVIAWAAVAVDRGDAERRKIEEALAVSKDELSRLLNRFDEPAAVAHLRRKMALAFAAALLLTCVLALWSWHNVRRSEEDAGWVSHTQEVLKTLQAAVRHLMEVESGARGFALSGHDPLLQPYETGRLAIGVDLGVLRHLTADNFSQHERLDVLEPQVSAKVMAADALVSARRQKGAFPTVQQLDEGKRLLDAARDTLGAMEAEEERLLEQRARKTRDSWRWTISILGVGSFLGISFLLMAGLAIYRQIAANERANALNAELNSRIQQRTAALEESEGRLASVIQSATDSIITLDDQQRITLFNTAAERMFRCPAAEAIGQSVLRFIPPRFHAPNSGQIWTFGESGAGERDRGNSGTMWGLRAGGEEFPLEASISQIESGGRKLSTVILRDLTERQRAEEAGARMAAVVEYSDDAIISKTLDGTITTWNSGAEKVFGYTAAEAVGKPLLMLSPPERLHEESDILAHIARGESVEHFETVRIRKDGTRIDVSATISPIRDTSGVIVGASKIARDITGQKRVEQALRESEERFQGLADGLPQLAWMAEADGHIFWYNQRWYDYTGTTFEQMEGWAWQSVHDPDMLPKVLDRWQTSLATGEPLDMEFPLRGADGKFRMFLNRVMPLKNAKGRVVRWFGTNTDISERQEAEELLAAQAKILYRQAEELAASSVALEKESRMLKLVLDSVGEGLIAADREGRFIIWNDSATKLMGRGAADLPSEQWTPHYDVFLPDGITPYPPDRLPLVLSLRGESVHVELMVENPEREGGVFMEVTARPMKDAEGNLCGGVAVLHDITERKRAEADLAGQAEELSRQAEDLRISRQGLEAQTRMLELVLDSMGEGLVAADREGRFIIWNDAAKKLMGQGATDLPNEQWTSHYKMYLVDGVTPYPTDDLPLVRALRGESVQVEMMIQQMENEPGVFLEVTARPLKDNLGSLCGGVVAFRDVTGRKAAEREIQQLNRDLETRVIERTAELQAANQDLEAFTYSVSHDLRAPLRHMSGFTRILVEDFAAALPDEAQRHLERIEQGAQHMGVLVDELLNLTRVGRQPLTMQVTGLSPIVKDVLTLFENELEDRKVEWKIGELPFVECDPNLVRLVFQNLISNALKYSRPRSPAVIEIGQTEKDGRRVLFVRDNGVGFSMKYADKLFGVFQRLHRAEDFEGTGVGLATVQRIVKKHGGEIWAEAELDKGATFYFTLSSAEPEAKQSSASAGGL
jgi:PAS domain S-box-containing protein